MNAEPKKNVVSIVIPVYNEAESLEELHRQVVDIFREDSFDFEIIFADDGSDDGSYEIEQKIAAAANNVRIIRFKRNRGKAAALNEGFQLASGEYVVTIDADLQDDPGAIPELVRQIDVQAVDLISGWKQKRQDRFIKKYTSRIYNFVTRKMTGVRLHDMNNGLKAYKSEVVKSIDLYGEQHRFIPVLAMAQGYRSGELKVRHFARKYGRTKYGVSRFWRGFLDLLTVMFTLKFSKRPMHFFGMWGLVSVFLGLVAEIYMLILKYAFGEPFQKHIALLLLGVLLLVFGMQFFSLGLIGEMITYNSKKKH